MFSQDHSYAKHPPTATVPTSNILNIDDVGVGGNATVFTTTSLDAAAESWEGSVTRCICEFQHDDGYMICCDRCGYVSSYQFLNLNLFILSFFNFTLHSQFNVFLMDSKCRRIHFKFVNLYFLT